MTLGRSQKLGREPSPSTMRLHNRLKRAQEVLNDATNKRIPNQEKT